MTTVGGYRKSEQYGGTGGQPFQDNLTDTKELIAVSIRHGDKIDAILGVWKTKNGKQITGKQHGGYGGDESIIVLEPNEKIINVKIHYGSLIDSLEFHTNQNRQFGPFGGTGGEKNVEVQGGNFLGFFGRAGDELDAIGFFFE